MILMFMKAAFNILSVHGIFVFNWRREDILDWERVTVFLFRNCFTRCVTRTHSPRIHVECSTAWATGARHFLPHVFIPSSTKLRGILDSPCLSVRLSVRPSVCPLTFRVRPVASTVQDEFFPYLVQMINSMRGCVACDDPWPWPISSRPFSLDLENRVRSVASTVLDRFFLDLAQMLNIIRGCVACCVSSESGNLIFGNLKKIRLWPWEKIYSSRWILSIFSTNDH